jgi:hypothetical protein
MRHSPHGSDTPRCCRWIAHSHRGGRATAHEENEYEIDDRHAIGRGIDRRNRRDCAGWNGARPADGPDHRRATDTYADDCSTDRAHSQVLSARTGVSVNEQIVAPASADRRRAGVGLHSQHRRSSRLAPACWFAVHLPVWTDSVIALGPAIAAAAARSPAATVLSEMMGRRSDLGGDIGHERGRSSSQNSFGRRGSSARRCASALRSSTRRIFPEMVFGSALNSRRRMRL